MPRTTRTTKQKQLLLQELSSIKKFFSAEDLHEQAVQQDPNIGIATVYRFLNTLRDKGELYSYTCKRRTVYSKGKKSHCHFTCERTGKVIHFDVDNIDFLNDKIPGTITSFQLEVTGICHECKHEL